MLSLITLLELLLLATFLTSFLVTGVVDVTRPAVTHVVLAVLVTVDVLPGGTFCFSTCLGDGVSFDTTLVLTVVEGLGVLDFDGFFTSLFFWRVKKTRGARNRKEGKTNEKERR